MAHFYFMRSESFKKYIDKCYILLYTVKQGGDNMKMIISNSSSVPIYEQIKKSIINQILEGELNEDELLPSIRVLAQDIKISAMTIKKAYDELEKEGYLKSIQGKGTFVAPKNTELAKEQAQRDIETYIEKIVAISKRFDIGEEDIIEMFKMFYREEE